MIHFIMKSFETLSANEPMTKFHAMWTYVDKLSKGFMKFMVIYQYFIGTLEFYTPLELGNFL